MTLRRFIILSNLVEWKLDDSHKLLQIPLDVHARQLFLTEVKSALSHAYKKHGTAYWSRHEFYGVLLEEVDELWAEIKNDSSPEEVLKELLQVVGVCLRFVESNPAMVKELKKNRLP